jgi:hypothetical protein
VIYSAYRYPIPSGYNTFMEPTIELIRHLDAEDVEQARHMTGSQKLRAGGDLFDDACRWTLAGIRAQFPGISEHDALVELRRRIAEDERMEKVPW